MLKLVENKKIQSTTTKLKIKIITLKTVFYIFIIL